MRFITNFSITFLTQIITLGIGVINSMIIVRNLGPEGQGMFTLVTTSSALLVLFFGLGLQYSNTYMIGNNRDKLSKLFSNSMITAVFSSSLLFAFYYICARHILSSFITDFLIKIILISVPFMMFIQLNQAILLGLQDIYKYNLVSITRVGFFMILNIILILFLKSKINILLMGWLFSVALTAMISIKLIFKCGGRFRMALEKILLGKSIKVGMRALSASIFAILLMRSDIYLIKYFRGNSELGYYSIAVLMAETILIAPQIAGQLIFAKASAQERESCSLTVKINRISVLYSFIYAVGIALFGRYILSLFFGHKFIKSYLSLLLLLPGFMAISCGSALGGYIVGDGGYPVNQILAILGGFIINLSLNIILIPKFGIEGAALSSSIAYIFYIALFCKFFKQMSSLSLQEFLIPRREDFQFKV